MALRVWFFSSCPSSCRSVLHLLFAMYQTYFKLPSIPSLAMAHQADPGPGFPVIPLSSTYPVSYTELGQCAYVEGDFRPVSIPGTMTLTSGTIEVYGDLRQVVAISPTCLFVEFYIPTKSRSILLVVSFLRAWLNLANLTFVQGLARATGRRPPRSVGSGASGRGGPSARQRSRC